MEAFISFIKSFIDLSEAAEKEIRSLGFTQKLSKGDVLLEAGKINKRQYYIVEGTIRTYFYENGKELTYWIYPHNHLVTSWFSYVSEEPSSEYIEATESAIVVSLTKEEWDALYQKYPELERFGRMILEDQMALLDNFYKGYYFKTAKEKYELLLAKFPDITLRANLGHIASLLGISQETLSRIRGK